MKINGHQITRSMQALHEVEVALGHKSGEPSAFRRINSWLLRESLLKGELRRRRWSPRTRQTCDLPKLSEYPSTKLLMARFLGERWNGPTAAQAIFFESNLRGFYADPHAVTVKILGPSRSLDNFKTDVDVRRKIGLSRTVNVPPLIHVDLEADPPFLCERFVPGQTARSGRGQQVILSSFLPSMCRLYDYFGLSEQRLGDFFVLDEITDAIGSASLPTGWDWEEACREALLHFLSEKAGWADMVIPVSLGHGDLSPQNMIVSPDGRISVVDWELSAHMPIAWDLRKLLWRVPGSGARFSILMKRHLDVRLSRRMLPLNQQFALVAARRLALSLVEFRGLAADQRNASARRLVRKLRFQFAAAGRSLQVASAVAP